MARRLRRSIEQPSGFWAGHPGDVTAEVMRQFTTTKVRAPAVHAATLSLVLTQIRLVFHVGECTRVLRSLRR